MNFNYTTKNQALDFIGAVHDNQIVATEEKSGKTLWGLLAVVGVLGLAYIFSKRKESN
ncbi:MAG: hypothetical protein Q8O94_02705 [bacterium]|nr:hypothetical protein [bacterium]